MKTSSKINMTKLLASIETALTADALTDVTREKLLAQVREALAKPVKAPTKSASLRKITGFSRLEPFYQPVTYIAKGTTLLHREGRTGWKSAIEERCYCCVKSIAVGGRIQIVDTRDGYRLAHFGCALHFEKSVNPTIAHVVAAAATQARIAVIDGMHWFSEVRPGRCEVCLMSVTLCDGHIFRTLGVALASGCKAMVAELLYLFGIQGIAEKRVKYLPDWEHQSDCPCDDCEVEEQAA